MTHRYRSFKDSDSEDAGHKFEWFGNNRHICDVLEDMRKCAESLNFTPMKGLIEEAQVMSNRMEAALNDQKDLIKLNKAVSTGRKAYKELELQFKELEAKVKSKLPKPIKK